MATIVSTRSSAPKKLAGRPDFASAAIAAVDDAWTTSAELARALYLTRPDGTLCFGDHLDATAQKLRWERLQAAVRKDGGAELAAVARRVERREARTGKSTPAVSYHHEDLRTSLLQTDWSADAAQLAVDWSEPELRCELVVGGDRLFSGIFALQAMLDGRPVNPTGTWEEVCWESDKDADYLELEIALERGLRLQRQFVLTRTDGLLFVADALLGKTAGDLTLELALPTAPSTKVTANDETRELRLTTGRRNRLAVPLGLPEWRSDRRRGEVLPAQDRVAFRQSAQQATALYAPLCVVLDSRRASRQMTWRQLTVGANLEIQPDDRAVGYRLQLGKEQWMFYRSLTERANRSVLGVNLQTNFLFARFLKSGEIYRLMEIED